MKKIITFAMVLLTVAMSAQVKQQNTMKKKLKNKLLDETASAILHLNSLNSMMMFFLGKCGVVKGNFLLVIAVW